MKQAEILKQLRSFSSDEAARWIMNEYPLTAENYYDAFYLVSHLSWKKKNRQDLAMYYLSKRYVSERPYESFLKIMPTHEFFMIINHIVEENQSEIDIDMLIYQIDALMRLHNPHKNTKVQDFELWQEFKNKIATQHFSAIFQAA